MSTYDETQAERDARVPAQLSAAEISDMYRRRLYSDIEDARQAGRLNVALGGEPPIDLDRPATSEDVSALFKAGRFSDIEALRAAGRLKRILDPTAPPEGA